MHFWSPSQTTVRPLPPKKPISKPHSLSSKSPVRLLLCKAKPSYVYVILKPHSQSSKSPVRLLSCKGKPNYGVGQKTGFFFLFFSQKTEPQKNRIYIKNRFSTFFRCPAQGTRGASIYLIWGRRRNRGRKRGRGRH